MSRLLCRRSKIAHSELYAASSVGQRLSSDGQVGRSNIRIHPPALILSAKYFFRRVELFTRCSRFASGAREGANPDFLAPAAKLIVEVDGSSHVGRGAADTRRDRKLARLGYRVVRVPAEEVLQLLPVVLETVRVASAAGA